MGPIISTPFSWLTCSCQSICNSAFTDYKHSVSKSPEKSFLRTRNLTEPTRSRTEAEENLKKHTPKTERRDLHTEKRPHITPACVSSNAARKKNHPRKTEETLTDQKNTCSLPTKQPESTQTSFFLLLQGEFWERVFCGKFSGKSGEGRGLRQNQTKNVRYPSS